MKQQTSEWVVDLSNPNADKITSGSTTNVSISNKQSMTAVQWLIEQVKSKEWQDMFIWHKEEAFEQAKAMEKKQIKTAYFEGTCDWSKPYLENMEKAEKYYNVTYNI